jgi:hypothetical protein
MSANSMGGECEQRSSYEEEFLNLSKAYMVGGLSGEADLDEQIKTVSEVSNETNNILFDSCKSNLFIMNNCSKANN